MSTLGWPIRHHTPVAMQWLKSVFLPYSKTASVGQAFPTRVLQEWSHLLPSPLPKPLLIHMASFTVYVQEDKHSSPFTREQANFKQSQGAKEPWGEGGGGWGVRTIPLPAINTVWETALFFLQYMYMCVMFSPVTFFNLLRNLYTKKKVNVKRVSTYCNGKWVTRKTNLR